MNLEMNRETGTTAQSDEYVLPFGDLLRVIWKRLWVIVLVAATLVGVAVAFSLTQVPYYQASIKILVGQESGITQNPTEVQGLQQLTATMVEAVNSRPLAEEVIQQLGLRTNSRDFLRNMEVAQIGDTQFIQVDYLDSDPTRAQQVADAVGEVFSDQVSEASQSGNAITATVWEPAMMPDEPASPQPVRNGLVALALGLMLGVGLAVLLGYFDDSWGSPEEAERISGVPTFGVVPEFQLLGNSRSQSKKRKG